MEKRLRITVSGTVQGVGFRPFVYRTALALGFSGWVRNDGEGVTVEIQGKEPERFLEALESSPPPLARIHAVESEEIPATDESGFRIVKSEGGTAPRVFLPPDLSLCPDCARELADPSDRRYRYPFINCVNCGPRYTITRALPYDRPNTSMDRFPMCPECRAEYENPANRRYHAQPVSCPECGPRLWLEENGQEMAKGTAALDAAAVLLKEGKIGAIKGMGGFHLICDASNEETVALLRERKRRPAKPFAVMFPMIESLEKAVLPDETERELILSPERPVVLVRSRSGHGLAPSVAPGLDRLGVFLPYTPVHLLLLETFGGPIVATSANLSEEPIITDGTALREKLGHVADFIVDTDREILNPCDDSVMMAVRGRPVMLRRARGFAPASVKLPFTLKAPALAVGANQKSTVAFGFKDRAVVSPHIGDLNGVETLEAFKKSVEILERYYPEPVRAIACDLHPGYASTAWAKEQGVPVKQVQHHYAHLLSALCEQGESGPLLAALWDGTGLGEDGDLWGGEFFTGGLEGFERTAHFRPFPLLGGEKAVKEPRRVALALLLEIFGKEHLPPCPATEAFTSTEIATLAAMAAKGLNAPQTTSAGRLFDGCASLLGVCQTLSFEGESGMLLEAVCDPEETGAYPFPETGGVIDWEPAFRQLAEEKNPAKGAARFFNGLARLIVDQGGKSGLPLLLSGGVFQNRVLLEKVLDLAEERRIRVILPRFFPPNDGGIALGQLAALS